MRALLSLIGVAAPVLGLLGAENVPCASAAPRQDELVSCPLGPKS